MPPYCPREWQWTRGLYERTARSRADREEREHVPMMRGTDRDYLLSEQYRTGLNLGIRRGFHERYSTNPKGEARWIFEQVSLPAHAKVLEVGCGDGSLWSQNVERIPPSWHLTLTDLSEGMLEEARQNLKNLPCAVVFRTADTQALAFPSHSFDGVIANYVLYHAPRLDAAISELSRILVPSGSLYTATHGSDYMVEMNGFTNILDPQIDSRRRSFELENGEQSLRRSFDRVERRLYEDSVEVGNPEAVVQYVASGVPSELVSEERLRALDREVRERMAQGGGRLRFSNSTGMFIASDPQGR